MLGFGRALGETMAVTMVIGNNPQVSLSLFAPQHTMAAVIANEFTEAADELYLSALVEIGLVLFVITLIVNTLSRVLIWSDDAHAASPSSRQPVRSRGDGMTSTGLRRKLAVVAVRRRSAPAAVLLALDAAGARACSSSSARASDRSTSLSSRTCRRRWASRAAGWRTRSSAR